MAVVVIVLSTLLTVLTAVALGSLLSQALRLPLNTQERPAVAFILGSACLSLIVFALCATHLYYRGTILVVAVVSVSAAFYSYRPSPAFPKLDKFERALLLFFVPFLILYLSNALAPETSPDGSTYHLGIIAHYVRAHGFVPLHTTVYSSLSQGVELIYMVAFTFGRHSAGALTHLTFFTTAAWWEQPEANNTTTSRAERIMGEKYRAALQLPRGIVASARYRPPAVS